MPHRVDTASHMMSSPVRHLTFNDEASAERRSINQTTWNIGHPRIASRKCSRGPMANDSLENEDRY